ncbi:MAG TPA: redoxin domain-containing protein [Candidatus Dormibacteraeota bacterium]|nr:redoxin domain-containing protein [Candidatus Dormibacteraeota bacterium]
MEGKPYSQRLLELEERFEQLEPLIPEGSEKEAMSVLHGIVQELWRHLRSGGPAPSTSALTLADIAELHRSAPPMEGEAQSTPLPVGAQAPDITLQDSNGRLVSLRDFGGQLVILIFYPLDWSPSCSDQLSLYQAESGEFARYGAQLLAVSADSIYSHGAWAAVRGLTFPLLADFEPKGEAARRYQVWRCADGFSERALYVIDKKGAIRYSYVSPKLSHVPDIYELYRVLDGLQARVHGAPQVAGRK